MKSGVIGFPRIGRNRELKFLLEKYFRGEVDKDEVTKTSKELRREHWSIQKDQGIDFISSNDFSYYDGMLDTIVLLNAIPDQYKKLELDELSTYFAMARGYQGKEGDVRALAMKKWFNTNYHYIVPELDDDTTILLESKKPIEEYQEAKEIGIETKPVIIGGFTFLKLARYLGKKRANDFVDEVADAYRTLLGKVNEIGAQWVQFDEPILVTDLSVEDKKLFQRLYNRVLQDKGNVKVLLQTYFGDIRDCYDEVMELPFDGVGLDFIEGKKSLELLKKGGFPSERFLFAGVINGKNIWRSNYYNVDKLIREIKEVTENIVIQPSCSLLHVPFTVDSEIHMKEEVKQYFSFAFEKLKELQELGVILESDDCNAFQEYQLNQKLFATKRLYQDEEIQRRVKALSEERFGRSCKRVDRERIQKEEFGLPILPTTTIGSFPQTVEVKTNRSKYRRGEIDKKTYSDNIKGFIKECIKLQEDIGLDVLVHGEYERNDMVEFFGENLKGYVFSDYGWVQSYGTRCVKPPIIFGDIKREKPITVEYSAYAQSLTDKPVKGMLTGPVTILNWSFPREDISLRDMAFQIGIAIQEEVNDLEAAGIRIIQIDEAALKEKLPIRREEWYSEYLDFAIPAFRLCHSMVKPETQIHTHMCYSEFEDIIKDIDNMDADVISFEASRSKLSIIQVLKDNNFETEVGPGVYDIHSPRVPSVHEIVEALKVMLTKIDKDKLWVNPDCGLKTRGIPETVESLKHMVEAAKIVRANLK
jgi:5-methyltetrahydropteroyltriglutamate--homocysteine methyltransferase